MRIFFELGWFFRQQWLRYLGAIISLISISVLSLIPPWLTGRIVDAIQTKTLTIDQLSSWTFYIVAVGVATYLLRFAWRTFLYGAAFHLSFLMRQRLYRHLTQMTPEFFQHFGTGDLMARTTNDINALEMTAGDGVLSTFDGILTGTVILFVLSVFISWKLTLIALIPWPFMGYYLWRVGEQLHAAFTQAQATFSDLNERTQENISAIRLIKAFGQQPMAANQFNGAAQNASNANAVVASVDAKYDPAILLTIGASFLFSVIGGAWFISNNEMTIGELTTFTMYLGYLIWPIFAYGWMLNIIERGTAAHRRIMELLETKSGVPDTGQQHKLESSAISLDVAHFSYPNTARASLQDIALTVPAGSSLGIVGSVGAGKTTLVNLLARFYENDDTHISIGGRDLRDYSLNALRDVIAVVPQDPFLFSATIKENIALGHPDATLFEIETAARYACVHDDIMRFSNGYQTMVGERGLTLSGGQKQRIAIARALLRNSSLLILDDALSAVDVETETSILKFIKEFRRGCSNIIVCHRLSAVAHAEQIIVLEQGKIIEKGTHAELLARNGWYAQTYQYQLIERAVDAGK